MSADNANPQETMNENQQRHLWVSCQHIDKLLSEVEHILNVSTSKATFPIYYLDIAPAQRRIIEDYIARIRAQLVRVLESQRIPTPRPSIPVRRAILATLGFVDIAVEELLPRYMRGYGALPQAVAVELNGIVGELGGQVSRLTRYIMQSEGEDLKAQLRRLEQTGDELHLLREVERVVTERGLVEYRLTISSILDRLEDKTFEIAIFGRVSSGKSSLLNAALETSVLPVGVTPITAVPTRIIYGDTPSLAVRFSERTAQTFGADRLAEFATEQQNPGNRKHVTTIVVRLSSSRLRLGVAFVDTPGLGALATSGAAETLAYLPRCDLGVVLIDAGSTLTPDDLRTIQTLLDAAVPVSLLLSKADLLSPDDLERVVAYVREHVATECRLELPVHAVSSLSTHSQMLREWFEKEILPLYERAQELKAASIRRKVGALRESVTSALRVRLRQKQSSAGHKSEVREIESRLRRVTGKLEELRGNSLREVDTLAFQGGSQTFDSAAAALLDWWESRKGSSDSAGAHALELLRDLGQEKANNYSQQIESLAKELVRELKQAATVLELSHAPDEDEFSSVVRGMPTLELPSVNLRLTKPVLAKWLGGIARGQVARELREQTGAAYEQAIENYYGMLRQWLLATFGQLRRRFDAYAESYRAQAQQTLGGGALTAEEARKIKQDLEALGAADAGSKPLISGEADVPADK